MSTFKYDTNGAVVVHINDCEFQLSSDTWLSRQKLPQTVDVSLEVFNFQVTRGSRGKSYRKLYVPQTVYSHNMTSWRAREARMYHWLCLILLKLSELTKHNRSNLVTIYTSNNMIYTIVLSITYKLSPSPHIRMWKKYFTYTINFRIISHTRMRLWHLIWSIEYKFGSMIIDQNLSFPFWSRLERSWAKQWSWPPGGSLQGYNRKSSEQLPSCGEQPTSE